MPRSSLNLLSILLVGLFSYLPSALSLSHESAMSSSGSSWQGSWQGGLRNLGGGAGSGKGTDSWWQSSGKGGSQGGWLDRRPARREGGAGSGKGTDNLWHNSGKGGSQGGWLDRRPARREKWRGGKSEEELQAQRERNREREPNLRGELQPNNTYQSFQQDEIFKFQAPWKLTDPDLPRDFWRQMKDKYEEVGVVKLTTRPARRRADHEVVQDLMAMGPGAKETLEGIIKDMAKYKPEARDLYEVEPELPVDAENLASGGQRWSEGADDAERVILEPRDDIRHRDRSRSPWKNGEQNSEEEQRVEQRADQRRDKKRRRIDKGRNADAAPSTVASDAAGLTAADEEGLIEVGIRALASVSEKRKTAEVAL